MLATLAAAFLVLCLPVQGQSVSREPAYGLSGRIGLGMATMPTYEGSPNRHTLAAPELTLSYRSRDWGSVDFGQRGLSWYAVEAGRFRFALVAQVDLTVELGDDAAASPRVGRRNGASAALVMAYES